MRVVVSSLALVALLAASAAPGSRQVTCPGDERLGSVAFVRGGALHAVDLEQGRLVPAALTSRNISATAPRRATVVS